MFGDNFTGAVDGLGGEGDDILTGTGAGETFLGAQGDDTLIGNGGERPSERRRGRRSAGDRRSSRLQAPAAGGSGIDTVRARRGRR